MQRKKYLGQLE